MTWATFLVLIFLIFGQHYLMYPLTWKAAWRRVKGWFGV